MANIQDYKRNHYIKTNNLQDSYIDKKIIYQYRRVLPERMIVGKTKDGKYQIFFEETRGSLKKRNYGKSDVVTSWNLLFSNGKKSNLVTMDFLKKNEITFATGYSINYLIEFVQNNNKRTNALNTKKHERARHSIWVDDDEFEIIQEFIKKLREARQK